MTDFEALINIVKRRKFVVLNSETTGLQWDAEICQLAIVDPDGKVLIDTLLKPSRPIPWDATQIHGITNEQVFTAPALPTLLPQIMNICMDRDLIIYNSEFDLRMLKQSMLAHGDEYERSWQIFNEMTGESACAMLAYAEHFGEWDDYHGNYRWQRLTAAIRQQGLEVNAAHSAIGDCLMTLALVKHLATKQVPTE